MSVIRNEILKIYNRRHSFEWYFNVEALQRATGAVDIILHPHFSEPSILFADDATRRSRSPYPCTLYIRYCSAFRLLNMKYLLPA